MRVPNLSLSFFCALALFSASAQAATEAPAAHAAPAATPQERHAVTHHHITIGGRTIAYTATAGTILLKNDKDQPEASVFYVAYTEDGADHAKRPVTFLYNGGPGAGSVFLHMGALGPRRIDFPDAKSVGGPPYHLIDNQYSLLDASDLVFIDAPGTGYSRVMPGIDGKTIYGIDQDAAAFGQFISRYVTSNDRWNSPKFLLGESYGTPRSAVLVDYLQNHNMAFNGVVLLSSVLDFDTIAPGPGNDLAYVAYLPTEAAVRWYHDNSPNKGSLESVVDAARTFANGAYATALMQGSRLSQGDRAQVAAQVAKFTGLSQRYVEQANLRVEPGRFEKQLLGNSDETTGRLDARYTGYSLDTLSDSAEYDPSDAATNGAFQSLFMSYARDELNYDSDATYRQINYEVNENWDFTRKSVFGWLAPTTSGDLKEAMTTNPRLHVFVGAGYFDMATPFGAAEWTFSHLGLPDALRSHVAFGYYDSGHMIYLHAPALAKFHADLVRFYNENAH